MRALSSFLLFSLAAGLLSCSSSSSNGSGTGGATTGTGGYGALPGTGGAAATGGGGSSLLTGGALGITGGAMGLGGTGLGGSGIGGSSSGTGGVSSSGTGGIVATGGSLELATGGVGVTGGVTDAGGATSTGGSTASTGGVGGSTGGTSGDTGGTTATGGATAGGAAGESGSAGAGTGGTVVGPGTYALPPPSQCHNEDDYQGEGCVPGDEGSLCGGKCNVINACQESSASKPNADSAFICPRFMLFSPEMLQAAIDDGNSDFNYAIVGHDVDQAGIDGSGTTSTCCQCYQLVYAYPSPNNERQVLENPDNPNPPVSAIPLPKPLIVQSFNTAATQHSFDVYMAAGGFGANNSCAPNQQPVSASGLYMYTDYPTDGQPSSGGVKPVTHYSAECKNSYQWVTYETLSSEACQSRVADACNQIASDIPGLTEQSRYSCIESNNPDGAYHMNWSVYVMKVECPQHLTEVTGCRLENQELPPVDRNALTPEQAAANPSFWDRTGSGEAMYETTTMEDCCRPSCASTDWIIPRGLVPDGDYNAFYSCDVNGVPYTEDRP